jgi:sec-independent protein translocase protein TatA
MIEGLLIGTPSGLEIGIIVLVLVILFGASRIPDLARSLGEAKSEFQRGLEEGREGEDEDEETEQSKPGSA